MTESIRTDRRNFLVKTATMAGGEFESDAARERRGSLQEGAAFHAFSFAAAWMASFTRA